MSAELEHELLNIVRDGLRTAVKDSLSRSYNSPLDGLLVKIIGEQSNAIRLLLVEGISEAMVDGAFRDEVKAALRTHLARVLVQRFGGELEKQVNTLKSDPATRARITLAIEEILKTK